MKNPDKQTKTWTKAEKLKIIAEAKRNGVTVTLEKYKLYPGTYYYWKKKFTAMGAEGMDHGMTKARLKRIRELEKEVSLLKEIVAEKELESKLKDELLKKKYPHLKNVI
ncbi:transposase [Chitinophagales bacterium]|nr:transposase [Chitinophagales bacterium]